MLKLSSRAFRLARCCHTEPTRSQLGDLHSRFFEYLKEKKPLRSDSKLAMMVQLFKDNPQVSMKEINERCNQIIKQMEMNIPNRNPQSVRAVLDILIDIVPAQLTTLKVFVEGTKSIYRDFEKKPNKGTFLKLCFYFGFFKKKPPGPMLLKDMIDRHCESIIKKGVSTMDLAIICSSTYKASVRFDNQTINDRVIEEVLNATSLDELNFGTFIKSLRLNRIYSEKLLDKLRLVTRQGDLEQLGVMNIIHIFAYIADNSVKDDELSKAFIDTCVSKMNETTRAKDIQKLLYSCALLNISVNQEYLEKLNELIVARTKHVEFNRKFDGFVDVALSMWMLGFKPRELVDKVLTDPRFNSAHDPNMIKIHSKKKLLLTCLEIEEPSWISDIEIPSPSFIEQRPAPPYLVKPSLEKLRSYNKTKEPRIVQQIRNLNIAGLLIEEEGKTVHVEALDASNCMSDRKSPNGIFALKLRLLRHQGCEVRLENLVSR